MPGLFLCASLLSVTLERKCKARQKIDAYIYLQLKISLHDINTHYHDVHNWSLYEKLGLLKADTATIHPENSGFHYYNMLPIFITDTPRLIRQAAGNLSPL